jgi:hypothetical protein
MEGRDKQEIAERKGQLLSIIVGAHGRNSQKENSHYRGWEMGNNSVYCSDTAVMISTIWNVRVHDTSLATEIPCERKMITKLDSLHVGRARICHTKTYQMGP